MTTVHGTPPIDYVRIATSMLDHARAHGLFFWRASPHADAALIGARYRPGWTEVVRINGWQTNRQAWKQRTRLVLASPSSEAFHHLTGSALNILNQVVCW